MRKLFFTTEDTENSRGARRDIMTPFRTMKIKIITLTICFVLTSGCMSLPKADLSALKPPGPVTAVLAAWEPAVSNGEDSMRGFGGRIYFYDQEMLRPVKIKGTVVVYAFDEDERSPWDAKPDEGFVFDSKTLNSKSVYSKSKLGHSYNLWIPIDKAESDSPLKKVSLIVRYIPEKGSSIVSAQTTTHLPGRSDQERLSAKAGVSEQSDLRSAWEERTIEPDFNRSRAMQSATIR